MTCVAPDAVDVGSIIFFNATNATFLIFSISGFIAGAVTGTGT